MAINTGAEWRLMFGQGLVFALSAIFAIAVGILIRQSAGAIAILILWPLLVENLLPLIPKVGDDLQKWTPFTNGEPVPQQGQDMGLAGAGRRRCHHRAVAVVGAGSTSPPGRSALLIDRPGHREQARRLTRRPRPRLRGPGRGAGPGRAEGSWPLRPVEHPGDRMHHGPFPVPGPAVAGRRTAGSCSGTRGWGWRVASGKRLACRA